MIDRDKAHIKERGFILFFVIIMIFLLSVITLTLNRSTSLSIRAAGIREQKEKRYFQMQAVLMQSIFDFTRDISGRSAPSGESITYDGESFQRIILNSTVSGFTDAIRFSVNRVDGTRPLSISFRYHIYPADKAFENTLSPKQIALDGLGGIYFADDHTHSVYRKDTLTGDLVRIAGTGSSGYSGDGGLAIHATLKKPDGIAIDPDGNILIADTDNFVIRRVNMATFLIETICGTGNSGDSGDGGPAISAMLKNPRGIHVHPSGDIYIADTGNHRIRKINHVTLNIETVAGTGMPGFDGDERDATTVKLNHPNGIFVETSGTFYIGDTDNNRIRKVDVTTGKIKTVAGSGAGGYSGDEGPAIGAKLHKPKGLFIDGNGNIIIADADNHRVRQVDGATGIIDTIAGNGSPGFEGDGGFATSAKLDKAFGVALDPSGTLIFSDPTKGGLRRVDPSGIITSLVTTSGLGLNKAFKAALTEEGDLYIADSDNNRVQKLSGTGSVSTVAGNGTGNFAGDGGSALLAELKTPKGVAIGSNGDLFIADTENSRIRKVSWDSGIITTIAGDGNQGFSGDGGQGVNASLNRPNGIDYDGIGNLYIADSENHAIRKLNLGTGIITTVAGNGNNGYSGDGGSATNAKLNKPLGVCVGSHHKLYIADTENHVIRAVNLLTGIIETIAGNGTKGDSGDGGIATIATLAKPHDVAVDDVGNVLIADFENQKIRIVSVHDNVISTLVGSGQKGFSGNYTPAISAKLNNPSGITMAKKRGGRKIFICDKDNNRIRLIMLKRIPELY